MKIDLTMLEFEEIVDIMARAIQRDLAQWEEVTADTHMPILDWDRIPEEAKDTWRRPVRAALYEAIREVDRRKVAEAVLSEGTANVERT
jgi:hypothetical protein